jgi:peptide/nickel transport system substrate-binding protein
MRARVLRAAAAALLMGASSLAATAAELRMGLNSETLSIDPHFANFDSNGALAQHIFNPLVLRDANMQPVPGLAESWRNVNDTTWEFKLRRGVKFHDGSELTAEDVKFSFERIPTIKNTPSSLTVYTKQIKSIAVVDKYTLRMVTDQAFPLMPIYLSTIVIVSKKAAENATTEDFNQGKAAIGTGPFKFVQWVKGERIVLDRFEAYWGPKAEWTRVTLRPIPNATTRVAALLSGDIDLMDAVPTVDLERLRKNPNVVLSSSVTSRLMFLAPDHHRDNSPFVTDKAGKPITGKGPLRDVRVRKAISMAIDRKAIAARIMDGAAEPTGQLVPKGFFGFHPGIPAPAYDPEGAKKLLAEAGYPNGFKLGMQIPQNRYLNDVATGEAIAQMLSRIGIETKVDAYPIGILLTRATKLDWSLYMVGFGIVTGEPTSVMRFLMATHNADKGLGMGNRGRYSNAKFDTLLSEAEHTFDDAKRAEMLKEAARVGVAEDLGIIPLYHQVHIWAMRKGLQHSPRTDEYTYVHEVRSK